MNRTEQFTLSFTFNVNRIITNQNLVRNSSILFAIFQLIVIRFATLLYFVIIIVILFYFAMIIAILHIKIISIAILDKVAIPKNCNILQYY